MPAQSPTLSPTLSAITAGLRGSSSGIPASTLPTRSAPTSAPLVKMPPPRRAKIEISEAPKARPTSDLSAGSVIAERARAAGAVVAGHADQPQADHQHAGDRAAAERDVQRRIEAGAAPLRRCARWRAPICSCRCSRRAPRAPRRPRSRRRSAQPRRSRSRRTAPRRRWRWSCTGGSGRPWRRPGSPPRSPACARCRPAARGSSAPTYSRTARRPRRRAIASHRHYQGVIASSPQISKFVLDELHCRQPATPPPKMPDMRAQTAKLSNYTRIRESPAHGRPFDCA